MPCMAPVPPALPLSLDFLFHSDDLQAASSSLTSLPGAGGWTSHRGFPTPLCPFPHCQTATTCPSHKRRKTTTGRTNRNGLGRAVGQALWPAPSHEILKLPQLWAVEQAGALFSSSLPSDSGMSLKEEEFFLGRLPVDPWARRLETLLMPFSWHAGTTTTPPCPENFFLVW